MAAPGEITLVALGPLTNLALAIRNVPEVVEAVHEVLIMGGALGVPGNVTPCAEFNILADAHAAHIVLHAGWPIRLVPLDVTEQALLKRSQADELAAHDSPVPSSIKRMLDFYFDRQASQPGVFPLHDPLCMASVVRPDLLTWQRAFVDVELAGHLTFGETVGFFESPDHLLQTAPNVLAAVEVNVDGFLQFSLERIQAAFPM